MGVASQLSSEGLDLWLAGDLHGAEAKTREALSLLPADHWANSYVRGQLAGVLDALGRKDEAREEYERALEAEIKSVNGDELHSSLTATRYFLGDLLVRMGEAQAALHIVRPGLQSKPDGDPALSFVEAQALLLLGKRVEAIEAARRSMIASKTDEQRERIKNRLAELGLTQE